MFQCQKIKSEAWLSFCNIQLLFSIVYCMDNVIWKLWIVYVYIASAVFQQHQYEVSISHLILYYIACCFCHDFHDRGLLLSSKLLKQWFLVVNVDSLFLKIYGRHHDLVNHYRTSVLQWSRICLFCRNLISILSSFMTCYKSVDKSDTSSAFGWVGTVYHVVIVTDDAILSLSLSTTSILYQQIMHQFFITNTWQ